MIKLNIETEFKSYLFIFDICNKQNGFSKIQIQIRLLQTDLSIYTVSSLNIFSDNLQHQ